MPLVPVTEQGGYLCPVSWCTHRDFTPSMLAQHVREAHPEETKP